MCLPHSQVVRQWILTPSFASSNLAGVTNKKIFLEFSGFYFMYFSKNGHFLHILEYKFNDM